MYSSQSLMPVHTAENTSVLRTGLIAVSGFCGIVGTLLMVSSPSASTQQLVSTAALRPAMATQVAADLSPARHSVARGSVSYAETPYPEGADVVYGYPEMVSSPTITPSSVLQRSTVWLSALAALTVTGAFVFWRRMTAPQPLYDLGPISMDLPTQESGWSLPAFLAAGKQKIKTRKAVSKRYRVTGSGKVVRRKGMKGHLLEKKAPKRRRRLSERSTIESKKITETIKGMMPYN